VARICGRVVGGSLCRVDASLSDDWASLRRKDL